MQDAEDDLKASSDYLLRVIRREKTGSAALQPVRYGALPVEMPKVVVAHSDVISWWVAVHGHEPENNFWIDGYRRIVARGLAEADVVVAPSRWMLRALEAHYGNNDRRTRDLLTAGTPDSSMRTRRKKTWLLALDAHLGCGQAVAVASDDSISVAGRGCWVRRTSRSSLSRPQICGERAAVISRGVERS